MEMMEAGIVSLDTHPDPKLATVPTATRSNASRTDHMPGVAAGAELWRIAAELRHCRRAAEVRVAGAHRSWRGLLSACSPSRIPGVL